MGRLIVVDVARFVIPHQKLVLDVLGEEWLLLIACLNESIGNHVHLCHVRHNLGVVLYVRLVILPDSSINCHHLVGRSRLLPVLFKRVHYPLTICKACLSFILCTHSLVLCCSLTILGWENHLVWLKMRRILSKGTLSRRTFKHSTAKVDLIKSDFRAFGLMAVDRTFLMFAVFSVGNMVESLLVS